VLSHIAAHGHGHHPQPASGPATWLGGTLPQWLTVAAAVIAFVWTVFLYRRSVADKRVESPRRVYVLPWGSGPPMQLPEGEGGGGVVNERGRLSTPAWDPLTPLFRLDEGGEYLAAEPLIRILVRIHNDSPEVITNVVASLAGPGGEAISGARGPAIDYVAPGGEKLVAVYFPADEYRYGIPALSFTDAAAHRWYFQLGKPVVLVQTLQHGQRHLRGDIRRARWRLGDTARSILRYIRG
jgi:hypothetical protein